MDSGLRLAFAGMTWPAFFDQGCWLKFEIRKGDATAERPYGLRYPLTLPDPDGQHLVGPTMRTVSRTSARRSRSARPPPTIGIRHTSTEDEPTIAAMATRC
jgi:hypothetical protein